MIFAICQFYYAFTCAISGTTVYDDFYITFYKFINIIKFKKYNKIKEKLYLNNNKKLAWFLQLCL